MGNHDSLTVASQGLLEEACQLRISIVNVVGVARAQGVDAVGKGQERTVDVSTFNHPLTTILVGIKQRQMN